MRQYTVNILFDSTGKTVTLLKKCRTEFAGLYNGCGGEIEDYEQPEECAVREINEETGLVFNLGELMEIGTLSLSQNIRDCKHPDEDAPVLVFYAGVIPDGQTVKALDSEPAATFPVESVLAQTVDGGLLAGNGDLLYFISMGHRLCADKGLFRPKLPDTPVCTGVSLISRLDRSDRKLPKLYECKFQSGAGKNVKNHIHYVTSRQALPRAFADKESRKLMPDGVTALLFDQNRNHVLLLKQFRYSVAEWVYTIPGGLVDPGETPLEAIQREVYEETGWGTTDRPLFSGPEDTKPMLPVFTDPALSDQSVQLFVLRACHEEPVPPVLRPGAPSPNELLVPVWASKAEASRILHSDEIALTQLTQILLYAWVNGADFTANN